MNEQEGIAILFAELRAPTGFLPRLLRGEELDRAGVERVQGALAALGDHWRPRSCIPRDALLALTYLDNALASPVCLDLYPTDQHELFEIHMDLEGKVLNCLMPLDMEPDPEVDEQLVDQGFWERWVEQIVVPSRNLSEQEAVAVLRQHLYGVGLTVALRCSDAALDRIGVEKAVELMHKALHTLQEVWAWHPCVLKDLAMNLATMRSSLLAGERSYVRFPSARQLLYTIGDELGAHLQRALRYTSTSGQLTLPWPEP